MLNKTRKSLVFKTTLLFLVIALIPYLLTTLLTLRSSEKLLHANIVKGLKKEADLLRDNLDASLFHMRSNAIAWAGLEVTTDILIDDVDKRIANTFEELKKDYGLSGELYAVKKNGFIVASSNPLHIGKKVTASWFSRILTGEMVDIDSHLSDIDGNRVIAFGVPVRMHKGGNEIIGAFLVEYKMDDLKTVSLHNAAIMDSTGKVVIASTGTPLVENEVFPLSFGEDGIGTVPDHIVAVSKSKGYYDFKGFGWGIALAEKKRKALKPIIMAEQATVRIGLLGLIVIFGLVPFFVGRSIRPIKELSRTAEEIAKTKNLSLRVESSRGDEVGRLADAFNYMIEEVNSHINQIREMEEQMRRTESLSALGELSAGMAHEIKNPLGIIKSSADIIKDKSETDSQNGVLAAAISEEATRLAKILETFLQFARPRPPMMSPCRINEILERAVDLLSTDMSRGSIAISKSLDETIPVIQSDLDQMYQVFVNIIINAIHAMPEGGRLEVATRMVSISEPSIEDREGVHISNDFIEISISDTGSGVLPEHKEKIFNPFFTTKEKGTGLGLAIVHGIVAKLGGQVKVEDGIPTGTCFKIYLPIEVIQ